MATESNQILFALLRCAVRGGALTDEERAAFSEELLPQLCAAGCKHDIAPILGAGLDANGLKFPGNSHYERIMQETMKAAFRQERMERAFQQICAVLEENAIAYIPLKGAVIRNFYPEPWMRTSCDIDILIHEEDLDEAVAALTAQGWRSEGREYHDVSLFSPQNVHLELHFSILENRENLDAVLQNAWDYARCVEGNRWQFTDAFFLFHLYAHASYHFLGGGCGLRTLLDFWVLAHNMGIALESARPLLEQAGIWVFAQQMQQLSQVCFSGAAGSDLTEQMLSYILMGGIYGTRENRAVVNKSESKSTALYALRRLFMPYRNMCVQYPVLKKWPVLLPVFWIVRLFRALVKGKTASSLEELQTFRTTTDAQTEEMKRLRQQLQI